jgi:hypothetical protein
MSEVPERFRGVHAETVAILGDPANVSYMRANLTASILVSGVQDTLTALCSPVDDEDDKLSDAEATAALVLAVKALHFAIASQFPEQFS